MQYVRQETDDVREAERLYRLGYRQTSNKFGHVARVEVPDVIVALKEKNAVSNAGKWRKWEANDFWRRCYSQDKFEGVDESVMKILRKLAKYDDETEPWIVKCVNNLGIEDRFDKGIEYVALMQRDNLWFIYDKLGMIRECLLDRFEKVS